MSRVPLGEKESSRLEFKGPGCPRRSRVDRTGGGRPAERRRWRGLGGAEGRERTAPWPSSRSLRPSEPEVASSTLWSTRLSRRSTGDEVIIQPEGPVLRITVTPRPGRGPYAFLRKGGRHFVIRVADRIRPMAREEIFERRIQDGDPVRQAVEKVLEEQKITQERVGRIQDESFWLRQLFWLRLQPAGESELKLDLDKVAQSGLLTDPTLTGNSRTGHNFTQAFTFGHEKPQIRPGETGRRGLSLGREGDYRLRCLPRWWHPLHRPSRQLRG